MPKIVDHDRYRKELLKKCFDLFAQRGYGSLTMRQVAQEIGVSTGTLYHYFPSKEALFLQLIEEITQQDTSISADDIQGVETIEERILALGQFLMEHEDYFHKQTLIFINFFQQPELEQEPIIEAVKRSNQRYQEAIMQFLGIDNPAIANHVSCLIDGLISQRAFDPESVSIKGQMELLAQMLSAYLDNQPIS
ncbi:MAG: TetR/AcrR family transcriptional regulator [Xenococcaceae cyanobacterium MO_167.B27]|nr:TetR/AcrR family transcriptional regulator [Xenococcaceae cyanobacterium MO_167.B27]